VRQRSARNGIISGGSIVDIGFVVFAGILGANVLGLLILSAIFAGGSTAARDYPLPSERL
jgi:hypothetical protein